MKWPWTKPFCKKCNVYFHSTILPMGSVYCDVHRAEQYDFQVRRNRVYAWVENNFDRIEKMMVDEQIKSQPMSQDALNNMAHGMAQQQDVYSNIFGNKQ